MWHVLQTNILPEYQQKYSKLTFCKIACGNMVNLTIFQNKTLAQIPNSMKMAENNMKKHLIEDFDKLIIITKNNEKVVTSVEFVK